MLIAIEGPGSAKRHEFMLCLHAALQKAQVHATMVDITKSPFLFNSHPSIDPETAMLVRIAHDRWNSQNPIKDALQFYPVVIVERFTRNTAAYFGGSKKVGVGYVMDAVDDFIDEKYRPDHILYVVADDVVTPKKYNPKSELTQQEHDDYEEAMDSLYKRDLEIDKNRPDVNVTRVRTGGEKTLNELAAEWVKVYKPRLPINPEGQK